MVSGETGVIKTLTLTLIGGTPSGAKASEEAAGPQILEPDLTHFQACSQKLTLRSAPKINVSVSGKRESSVSGSAQP